MENKKLQCLTLFFYFSFLHHLSSSSAFNPKDNYLIDCGGDTNAVIDTRNFITDVSGLGSKFLSATKTIILKDQNPSLNSSPLYHTARVFTKASTYNFEIKLKGLHLVRFHFFPFESTTYNLNDASFNVLIDGSLVFSMSSVRNNTSLELKEFILKLNHENVVISFEPLGRQGFGFVNGIEVFSAPDNLIQDVPPKYVGSTNQAYSALYSDHILETVHRINVGGPKITPFNDTLWRTWIPDEEFLIDKSAAKSVTLSGSPNYQNGLVTREIAPDTVYKTAQVMNISDTIDGVNFNLSWILPVDSGGFKYLVRAHFCDIVGDQKHKLLTFNVFLNGYLAEKQFDLSLRTSNMFASPYYIDFMIDSEALGRIRVSLGKSDSAQSGTVILNGLEVMKMLSWDPKSKKKHIKVLVEAVVGAFASLCVLTLALFLVFKWRKKKSKPRLQPAENVSWSPIPAPGGSSNSKDWKGTKTGFSHQGASLGLKFSFAVIQDATNNFDKRLVIGSGGFGLVYKGVLQDKTKVAVKRGVRGSGQGLPEFLTEISILSRIRHRHLVSLVGYCEEQSEMILVYEFMEKGPLRDHLYGSGLPTLTWKQRLEIGIGSARGLHYLHTGSAQGIIHRDIKSTNILLDENYVAKVADFGLSKSGPCLDNDETHVSTMVKGSFGYLDPEYFKLQKLTDKSDVYSFGVVLLEMLCARSAVDPLLSRDEVNLAEWAMEWQKKGLLEQIIDPKLSGSINPASLKKVGDTVEKCLADYGEYRPTMGDVLWNLEYALQLQETGIHREPHEDSLKDASELTLPSIVPPVLPERLDDGSHVTSMNATSQVFSQLVKNEGR